MAVFSLSEQPAGGRYVYSSIYINFYIYIPALVAQKRTTFCPEHSRVEEMIVMSAPKKSFLIYFDNYPMVTALPMEQRGVVLTFLMVYADRVGREEAVSPEEMMEQFPQLSAEARLVCSFMGANVLRDTRRWLNRQKNQTARRPEQKRTPDSDERIREDMARARRALELSRDIPVS